MISSLFFPVLKIIHIISKMCYQTLLFKKSLFIITKWSSLLFHTNSESRTRWTRTPELSKVLTAQSNDSSSTGTRSKTWSGRQRTREGSQGISDLRATIPRTWRSLEACRGWKMGGPRKENVKTEASASRSSGTNITNHFLAVTDDTWNYRNNFKEGVLFWTKDPNNTEMLFWEKTQSLPKLKLFNKCTFS